MSGFPKIKNGGSELGVALGASPNNVQYSPVLNMSYADRASFQLFWTSTSALNAACILQASCKADADETTDDDWETVAGVSFTGAAGSTADELVGASDLVHPFYRLKISRSSGTGTVDIHWAIKAVSIG